MLNVTRAGPRQVPQAKVPQGHATAMCDQELIHLPGAIQPHGALLAARADTLVVSHVSANVAEFLGTPPAAMLGHTLPRVLRGPARELLRHTACAEAGATACIDDWLTGPNGTRLHLHAHRTGRHLCIDIQLDTEADIQGRGAAASIIRLHAILDRLSQATGTAELCALAVRFLRAFAGYDRVMAYRFAADGHGEVIAEDLVAGMERYLGLHYPASDIPPQARQQYMRQRVGAIGDANYQPVALLADPDMDDGAPLDLAHSVLRSVSPVHREYMRNMGTAASLTVSLVHDEALWGMLVCHHRRPRLAGPGLRAIAGTIGQVVSLLLETMMAADLRQRRSERQSVLRALVDRLAAPVPIADALAAAEPELLGLVGATGAMVSLVGARFYLGNTPEPALAELCLATMNKDSGQNACGELLAVDQLGLRHPSLGTGEACGALLLPLAHGTDDAILWFRPGHSRTVSWGGNPAEHAAAAAGTARPAPRTSFAAWTETVRGRSAPWDDVDLSLARDLRIAVEAERANRTRTELARLRRFDAVSGSSRRKRELERSNADLEEFAYAASHDLKAPLRAIGHLAQWIGDDIGPTASQETLSNLALLRGRVLRLQVLLDGLLAYSRVGRVKDDPADMVNIAELVTEITAMLAPPLGFVIACVEGLPDLHTPRIPLEIVLTNLISNGIKHHDRAHGLVTVSMQRRDGEVEFRVTDDGPGVAPRFHDRIFLILQTLASRDDLEASGIGLAIVKKKVQARGGRIWVESAPPARGSSFVFTWPETPLDVPPA
jgi:light-regulated signal transduction histidine kinase (bacteriophytochrome)